MVKKLAAVLAVLMLVAGAACAEDIQIEGEEDQPTRAELAAQRPDDEDTHLTIANPTKVNGAFFTSLFGNNTSDIDVRAMLNGYPTVVWSSQMTYVANPTVVTEVSASEEDGNAVYTFIIADGLTYSDGQTPVNAKDYVFSWLLRASAQLAEIGADAQELAVAGFEAYHAGETNVFSGIRLIDDHTFSVALKDEFSSTFYQLEPLMCDPYPISVIAPGCDVADDGNGAYISGPFTAELLRGTILGENGYLSHPSLVTGPYTLTSYDAATGVCEFAINPYFAGNYEGVKPVIDTVTLTEGKQDTVIDDLKNGSVGLVNKLVDGSLISAAGTAAADGDAIQMSTYPRLGYGYIALACEKGPQQFQKTRQALMYMIDADKFVEEYMSGYGMADYSYYGLGQWMTQVALGTATYETDDEAVAEIWAGFNLDGLDHYEYSVDKAKAALKADGWTLNADGKPYTEGKDGLRYKKVGEDLMPLSFEFAKSRNNTAADKVADMLANALPQVGGELKVVDVDFTDLLNDVYSTGERTYDMAFMATNFVAAFDPYVTFGGDGTMGGAVCTFGMRDDELVADALAMRNTAPGNVTGYMQNWMQMIKRYNEVLPTLPIYSNVYADAYTAQLQDYTIQDGSGWPEAIIYAYIGEKAE